MTFRFFAVLLLLFHNLHNARWHVQDSANVFKCNSRAHNAHEAQVHTQHSTPDTTKKTDERGELADGHLVFETKMYTTDKYDDEASTAENIIGYEEQHYTGDPPNLIEVAGQPL